jgi:O-antigen ligase
MIAALVNPITILLATLCLQWVTLSSAGSFSIKFPYLALALVIAYLFTGPRKLRAGLLFVRENAFWGAPYLIYIVILAAVLNGTPGESIAPRQLFYVVGVIGLAGCLATVPRLSTIFRLGGILGLLILVVAVEMVARTVGLSWADAITAFLRVNLQFEVYTFLREVFNAVNTSPDAMVGAAMKNEVAVSVLVLGLLVRSGSKNPARDYVGMAILAAAFALLILLNTRSVLIVAAISLCIAAIVGAAFRPAQSIPSLLAKGMAAIGVAVIAVAYSFAGTAASGILGDRFAFDDYSSASRIVQYQAAFKAIESHPLTGVGYFESDAQAIHNLFLSSWVQVGVAGFALVVVFYLAVVFGWLHFLARVMMRRRHWVLPIAPEWLAPLPIMPLFRVWISGDAGHLFFGEWVSLGIFFGCILANRMQRQKRLALLRRFRPATSIAAPMLHQDRPAECIAS